ncbi:MAG: glycosyltransferase family 2 protein [Bacteroidales bacterium]|nr:glycosyltransferase family 2 protein [Bacteroidales bacterium]
METAKVAVVILNWNGEHYLRQFLPNVLLCSDMDGVTVVVADNGSTDGSVPLLRDRFPQVELIELPQNYGFAEGYNRALAQVRAEYYVLLNSDVEVSPNWLGPMLDLMEANPQVAACAPKLRAYHSRQQFEYAGAAGGFIDRWGYPFCQGRILSAIETDEGQYDAPRDVFWASGAAMFVRASAYQQAGGLDARFFAHMEEIDLCWRFHNMGLHVRYVPTSTVYHVGGGTLPTNSPRKLYLNYRNSLYMLHKNLNTMELWPVLLLRMGLDLLSAAAYLLGRKRSSASAVLRAHADFWRTLGSSRRARLGQTRLPRRRLPTIYRHSIVVSFFLLNKKIFSSLHI